MFATLPQTLLPAVLVTESGTPRRVGVEIEFANLEIDAVAALVAAQFGGAIHRDTDYEARIVTPELGEFRVEVDLGLLKRMGKERAAAATGRSPLEQMSEELLAALARQLAPCEIVTPPLPFERLADLDDLVARLREAGAQGTDDALVYAFGVHFNPEAPSLAAASVLSHLRAFVLLYDWLKTQLRVNPARRLTPFINPFPSRYLLHILAPGYVPDRDALIRDYLAGNPTRNRALDLLPLLAWLDKKRVLAAVGGQKINPRPAYHYRLSNSRVGDPYWRLTDEWRYWLVVEALAQNPDKLKAMAADYSLLLRRPFGDIFSEWTDRTRRWLDMT
ncbi:MAG: amidoligase family protein [Pseudomonadota bacterium]|nr:amidoligase family protein [Pseudomonadota bacterium]